MVDSVQDRSAVFCVAQLLGRIITTIFGAAIAGVMAVAGFCEAVAGDFFGTSISLMVVIFGLQLMSIGIQGSAAKPQHPDLADPLDELWRSDTRVYPFRPYSNLEIRGR